MTESHVSPAALTQRFAGFGQALPGARFTLGAARIDAALGGGLARGRLHEVAAAGEGDIASAAGFALMLALRAGGRSGNIVWIAEERGERRAGPLHPPGAAELGADPARLLFVTAPDEKALLRAAADVVRSPAAGIAVIAPWDPAAGVDLTATRRLTLFAERSGVTAILLRAVPIAAPSAAATRWRIAAARSTPLDGNAPGHPALTAELVRQRGGAPLAPLRLEWDRDAAAFHAPPLPGALPAAAGGGCVAAG